MVRVCNPSTQEAEAERCNIKECLSTREFKANLGDVAKVCLKMEKETKEAWSGAAPVLGGWRQEDQEGKAILGSIGSSKPARAMGDHVTYKPTSQTKGNISG